jgi:hypothetical protein
VYADHDHCLSIAIAHAALVRTFGACAATASWRYSTRRASASSTSASARASRHWRTCVLCVCARTRAADARCCAQIGRAVWLCTLECIHVVDDVQVSARTNL